VSSRARNSALPLAKRQTKFQEWQVKIKRWQAITYKAYQQNNKIAGDILFVF
jgi:hypothetical protein